MKVPLPHQSDPRDADLEAGRSALDWAVAGGSGSRIAERSLRQARIRRHRRRIAGAASLVLACALGLVWQMQRTPNQVSAGSSSAMVAAPASQVLPDGTIVDLRGAAHIAVDFSSAFRRVTLMEGEAYFQVAHNRERPFIVMVNGVEVRAVGTAFSVAVATAQVEVLVTEGKVQIDQPGFAAARTPATPAALVEAGNCLTVSQPTPGLAGAGVVGPARAVSATDVSERLAWRVPRIEFSGTPLAEVLPWFARYGSVRFVLSDPAIGSLQLSGFLRPDNPDSLLRILRNDFEIQAERQGDGTIVLRLP